MRSLVSKSLLRTLFVFGLTLPWACTQADVPDRFVLDQHYKMVRQPQQPENPKTVEVMEVFSYSCPHCFNFEPFVEKWGKTMPSGAVFVRQPWTLGQPAAMGRSKAAVAAQQLGVFPQFHRALFGAIHGQKKVMSSDADLQELFVTATGLDAKQFSDAFAGFATDNQVRRGEKLVRDLGITSVPTVVVDGRWLTNGQMAGGIDKVFEVVDFLIGKAKAERGIK